MKSCLVLRTRSSTVPQAGSSQRQSDLLDVHDSRSRSLTASLKPQDAFAWNILDIRANQGMKIERRRKRVKNNAAAPIYSGRRRGAMVRRGSEISAELGTDDARVVDEPGQVVEVDRTGGADLVGAVAAEHRGLVLAAVPVVADLQAAFEQRLADELTRLVQEEIDLAAVGSVGVDEDLAVVADRDAIAGVDVADPLGRLRQRIAIDVGQAVGIDRIGHRAHPR